MHRLGRINIAHVCNRERASERARARIDANSTWSSGNCARRINLEISVRYLVPARSECRRVCPFESILSRVVLARRLAANIRRRAVPRGNRRCLCGSQVPRSSTRSESEIGVGRYRNSLPCTRVDPAARTGGPRLNILEPTTRRTRLETGGEGRRDRPREGPPGRRFYASVYFPRIPRRESAEDRQRYKISSKAIGRSFLYAKATPARALPAACAR